MTDSDHLTHDHDPRDADGTAPERPPADPGNHVHAHVDGATHAHPHHGGAKRPGFLARLFGAPG